MNAPRTASDDQFLPQGDGEGVDVLGRTVLGQLLAIGALKQLDRHHAELKSMHTLEAGRGRGIGTAMVEHLIGVARDRGIRQVSLETGAMEAFAAARSLYAAAGFEPCGPFGDDMASPNSTFMTRFLDS